MGYTKWQKIDIEIPDGYTRAEREAIGFEIVEFIRERTKDGKSKRNQQFAGYSKEYEESLNFKIAGKHKGQRPDLTQSGDTLGALDVLETEDGRICVGFEKDSLENAIADGNIRGTYGHSSPIGPKRDFLGITKKDLERILERFPLEDKTTRRERARIHKYAAEQEMPFDVSTVFQDEE